MRRRTRIGSKVDAGRLAMLVSMPGIDPRVWVSLCIVDKVVVDDDGVFADVHIMSTCTLDDDGNTVAQLETVRVTPGYAGNGFGLFFPPLEGDEVLVVWPDGSPDHGGMLVGRAWSASDPPPSVAKDNPDDALLMVKKDAHLRIVVQGEGNIILQLDKGKVLLGDENSTLPIGRKGDPVDLGRFIHQPASGAGVTPCTLTWLPPGVSPTASPPPTPTVLDTPGADITGQIADGSENVESS